MHVCAPGTTRFAQEPLRHARSNLSAWSVSHSCLIFGGESLPNTAQLVRVSADALRSFVAQMILARGTSLESAQIVADVLVAADLRGVESHGVASLGRMGLR